MGSYNSTASMDVDNLVSSTSESDDGSDLDTNYAEIFRRLMRRHVTFLSACPNQVMGPRRPRIKFKPNTSKLNASEFYYKTRMDAGLGLSPNETISNVVPLLYDRQVGASFSNAKRCKIANNYIPNAMETFEHYEGRVFCGMFSENGKYFITASQEQIIRIYKVNNASYELVQSLNARDIGWSIIDVAFSPTNEHFVYSTWSTLLHLCSVEGDPEKQQPLNLVHTARRFCVFSLAFSSNGREILGGSNDGILFIYDLERNTRSLKVTAHDFDVNTVKFADYSSHIIYSGGDDGLIKVWDRRTFDDGGRAKPVGVLAGHQDGITYIDAKGDSRHLISNSKDQTIKLWDVRRFSTEEAAVNASKAVHDQTWDYRWQSVPKRLIEAPKIAGDTSVMTYRGHVVAKTLVRCRFSPLSTTGQRYIYTGCGTGRLIIYDALTGKIVSDLRHHTACVRDASWHPSDNDIMTASWDGTVGRWFYNHKQQFDVDPKDTSVETPVLRRSSRIAMRNSVLNQILNAEMERAHRSTT